MLEFHQPSPSSSFPAHQIQEHNLRDKNYTLILLTKRDSGTRLDLAKKRYHSIDFDL